MINGIMQKKIDRLKAEYTTLSVGKDALLTLINETSVVEGVFNSNAIENSTLTLSETEHILLDMEVSRNISVREVFEAKNLARVSHYIQEKIYETDLNTDLVLLLHQMLISNIDDRISGRFRRDGEYVRIGTHIAPAPELVPEMIRDIFLDYQQNHKLHPIEKISKFHLDFETIHPFCDGNGRIGRVIINYQLMRLGFPSIIIRDKEKKIYYQAFNRYRQSDDSSDMDKIVGLAVMESLHKRITYLKHLNVVKLSEFAKTAPESLNALLNQAKRQTIPAFRERGVWMIGK